MSFDAPWLPLAAGAAAATGLAALLSSFVSAFFGVFCMSDLAALITAARSPSALILVPAEIALPDILNCELSGDARGAVLFSPSSSIETAVHITWPILVPAPETPRARP